MYKIKAEPLTLESFYEFGSHADMLCPKGVQSGMPPAIFWPDKIVANFHLEDRVAFGVSEVFPREMILSRLEIHEHTCEIIMPLDRDIILAVAMPMRQIAVDDKSLHAFRIPKGTMVCLRPGVLHASGYTIDDQPAHVLIGLPELNYRTDLILHTLEEDNQFEIML